MNQLKTNPHNIKVASRPCWGNLNQAVSDTSGFKRWVLERNLNHNDNDPELMQEKNNQELMVQLYLRQTLENLAY